MKNKYLTSHPFYHFFFNKSYCRMKIRVLVEAEFEVSSLFSGGLLIELTDIQMAVSVLGGLMDDILKLENLIMFVW